VVANQHKPVVLYHGTSTVRWRKIQAAGQLRAQTGKGRVWRSVAGGKTPARPGLLCVFFNRPGKG